MINLGVFELGQPNHVNSRFNITCFSFMIPVGEHQQGVVNDERLFVDGTLSIYLVPKLDMDFWSLDRITS